MKFLYESKRNKNKEYQSISWEMEVILLEILNPKMWSHQLRKSFRREKYKVEARKLVDNHNIYVKLSMSDSKARFASSSLV